MRCKGGSLEEGAHGLHGILWQEAPFEALRVSVRPSALKSNRWLLNIHEDRDYGEVIALAYIEDMSQIEEAKQWLLAVTLARSE